MSSNLPTMCIPIISQHSATAYLIMIACHQEAFWHSNATSVPRHYCNYRSVLVACSWRLWHSLPSCMDHNFYIIGVNNSCFCNKPEVGLWIKARRKALTHFYYLSRGQLYNSQKWRKGKVFLEISSMVMSGRMLHSWNDPWYEKSAISGNTWLQYWVNGPMPEWRWTIRKWSDLFVNALTLVEMVENWRTLFGF